MSLIESKDSLEEIKTKILHALNRAGNDPKSGFRYIILSTVSGGFPNSRFVVLRKFVTKNQDLMIYTDIRSNKISEIKLNPFVSVLAYDKQKKCQIKLKGEIDIHHKDQLAHQHWEVLTAGHDSYNTEVKPGAKVDSLEEAHKMKSELDDENFVVLVLKVSQAEILQLNGQGHIRALFDFEKDEASYLVP